MGKKEGKKQRKHGRNKLWCTAYRNRNQREKNKARRLVKHLLRFPGDAVARAAFTALPQIARRGQTGKLEASTK